MKHARHVALSFTIVIGSVIVHELGHYIAALYFNLRPVLHITRRYIAVETVSGMPLQNLAIMNMGALANLILASILFGILMQRSRVCRPMEDTACSSILVAIIANLLFAIAELIQPFLAS